LLFLPPYSPDLNPIEESFSKLKAHLHQHVHRLHRGDDPVATLIEATGCITAEDSRGWICHAGYI
ncbi:hypothetical protein SCLCIDRAFT_53758, partial [Scleroderma citrinum Foug A]